MADPRTLTAEQIEVTRVGSAPQQERSGFIAGDTGGDTDVAIYFWGDDAEDDIVL